MAKGSTKLNMKRDDARTLMLKMDARLTFAGRERHAGFRLEGERELKHIEVTHRLINAELNRAKMEIQRRFDFYQALKERNEERRQRRDHAWCEEETKEWDRQARATRRRRALPKLRVYKNHKAEAVGSIRRDVKGEFANKMAHEMHINRSLVALSDSYTKHKKLTQKNEAKLGLITGHTAEEGKAFEAVRESEKTLLPITLRDCPRGPKISKPKHGMLVHIPKSSLPELSMGKSGVSSVPNEVSSDPFNGKVGELPGNARDNWKPTAGLHQPVYFNTSIGQQQHTGAQQQDLPAVSSIIHRTRHKGVYKLDRPDVAAHGPTLIHRHDTRLPTVDHPLTETKKHRISLSLGLQQTIPLRFYKTKENPFFKGAAPPAINRSRDLLDADKTDEMFEWLGFESREEFEKLQEAGLLLEYEREACSETSSILENDQ